MVDVVTCCPDDKWNGVVAHLKNMDDICNFTHFVSLPLNTRNTWNVVNQIVSENPSILIFGGAWNNTYKNVMSAVKIKLPNIKIGLLHCSPFGQTEISREINMLNLAIELKEEKIIDYLFSGSKHLENLKDVIWLPQTLSLKGVKPSREVGAGVALLNTFCGYKNILNQIVGYKISDVDDPLYINRYDEIYSALISKITEFKKMPFIEDRCDFLNELKTMRLILHVSFSESFAYLIAESHIRGVPCLVSKCLENWIPPGWKDTLVVKDNDSPEEIAEKIKEVCELPPGPYICLRDVIISRARKLIRENNEYTTSILKRLLNKISSK